MPDRTLVHDHPELVWTASGRAHVATPDGDFVADDTRAVWIPATIDHTVDCSPEALLLPIWLPTTRGMPGHPCTLARSAALDHWARQSLQPPALRRLPREEALRRLAAAVECASRLGPPPLPVDERARRIARRVLADLSDDRESEEWAAEVDLSSRSLRRIFVRETGMPLARWRLAARMHHAALLLLDGTPVAHVATACGYRNASAFTAAFTRLHGTPPSRFRP
ncbi:MULTISPECIES: helix-turn-helix transcriptional regulator [unclassified Luteococcus]|uniref:helix-turn-helix transcriptional regulator n=1 Tax=unclassified Luteococcus TaxID=2639923 RepID=UPI00313BDBA2